MSRMSTLWKASPRRVLAAVGGLLAAAAVAVGSGANFNSTSANPSNVFTTGSVSHSNSKANAAVLTVSNMVPGNSQSGTVDIKNTGSAPANFSVSSSTPVDNPVSPSLSLRLDLTVQDLGDPSCTSNCPAASTIYSGSVQSMPTLSLGNYAVGATHRYKFTVSFSDGGSGGADNAYQNASTSVTYNWAATS